MDNIQIWIYLIFGGIYLVSRFLKNKDKEGAPGNMPRPQQNNPQGRPNKPVTFEELLKEFTEGRNIEPDIEEEEEETYKPVLATEVIRERKRTEVQEDFSREGRNRTFSDEDSKRIYEESIKNAEGADLNFERDDHFKIKLKGREEDEDNEPSAAASEIAAMLQNSDSARKAVILSEILNRKY